MVSYSNIIGGGLPKNLFGESLLENKNYFDKMLDEYYPQVKKAMGLSEEMPNELVNKIIQQDYNSVIKDFTI